MLLLSDKRIKGLQIKISLVFISIVFVTAFFALFALLPDDYIPPSTTYSESDREMAMARPFLLDFLKNFSQLAFPIILFVGVIIIFNFMLLWTPLFVTIPVNGSTKRKGWVQNLLRKNIKHSIKGNLVVIRRKRSSLQGIFLREMVLEIHILRKKFDYNRIIDFLSYEKSVLSPTHLILLKTVKTQLLPLQVIQIRALLALITDPINVSANRELIN